MAIISQFSRISHHTVALSATTSFTGMTFTVPGSEDFTLGGWTIYDLALSEIGVDEFRNKAYIRIGNNINEFNFGTGGTSTSTTFTGNTSATCITDLYVSNIFGCSPITIHDSIQSFGSTATGILSYAFGDGTTATGLNSFAEGYTSTAGGDYSHAEGQASDAKGIASHAEGSSTATGNYSHSEGTATNAFGDASHAEGITTSSIGVGSHAEGDSTQATGDYSHAEGTSTQANKDYSHAEGSKTQANGVASHAGGAGSNALNYGEFTTSSSNSGTLYGQNGMFSLYATSTVIGGTPMYFGDATTEILLINNSAYRLDIKGVAISSTGELATFDDYLLLKKQSGVISFCPSGTSKDIISLCGTMSGSSITLLTGVSGTTLTARYNSSITGNTTLNASFHYTQVYKP